MTEDDVTQAGMGDDFHLNITETAKVSLEAYDALDFLNRLRLTVTMMKGLRAHYNTYPTSPQDFEPWRLQTVKLIEEARKKTCCELNKIGVFSALQNFCLFFLGFFNVF